MAATAKILQFFKRSLRIDQVPEPPAIVRDVRGAYALFMDEDEAEVLYAKPWPYVGCPQDERTNSTTWLIDGSRYYPARRDENGNWIFRRGQ